MRKILFILILSGLFVEEGFAQDPQYSQFYSAPLYLSPAFAGTSQQARVGANYRTQWPAIDANYVTFSAWGDYFIDDKNSGVGFIITRDREGLVGLTSTTIAAQYAYQIPITEKITFRPGIQAGYVLRDINFDRLTFGDQFDADGNPSLPTGENFSTGENKGFFDFSAGALLYSNQFWIGGSAHHINRPNQSLIGESSPLPIRWSGHAGYKFLLAPGTLGSGLMSKPQERSLSPTVQYRQQGKFSQLDLGLYFTYEPIMFGMWYRGLPFKPFEGSPNNEAIVFLVGFTQRGVSDEFYFGYSYDVTISQLGSQSGGAHEFSIIYSWFAANPRKPPKNVRIIPCPR